MACTSFNKTIIIGRVASEPEYQEAGEGRKVDVAKFTIYQSTPTKDGKEILDYHRICAFGNQASLVHKYISKGDLCCIEGRLTSETYKENSNKVIIAERITFLRSNTSKQNNEQQEGEKSND